MSHLHNEHDQAIIQHAIDHSIPAHPNSITIRSGAGDLFAAARPRVQGQFINGFSNAILH